MCKTIIIKSITDDKISKNLKREFPNKGYKQIYQNMDLDWSNTQGGTLSSRLDQSSSPAISYHYIIIEGDNARRVRLH